MTLNDVFFGVSSASTVVYFFNFKVVSCGPKVRFGIQSYSVRGISMLRPLVSSSFCSINIGHHQSLIVSRE